MFPNIDVQDFSSTTEADKSLLVKFFYKEYPDKAKTLESGRPLFAEVECIEIRIAGRRDAQACRPATYADKQRFPAHYEAFKARVAAPMEGLPLTEWPQIARSQIEQLSYLGVKTLEQLVSVSDSDITQMQGGNTLRAKATAWLESSNESAIVEERDALKKQVEEMQDQIAKMMEKAGELEPVIEAPKIELKKVSRRRGK
jgi:hypothetical protein